MAIVPEIIAQEIRPATATPEIILLSGPSSVGKTTTAASLKQHIEATSNKEVTIISYDHWADQYQTQLIAYVDTALATTRFKQGTLHVVHNPAEFTTEEFEEFEQLFEELGTKWMEDQLITIAQQELDQNKVVIIDSLDTQNIATAFTAAGTNPQQIMNVLLYVDFEQYPARLDRRNQVAIEQYHQDLSSRAYKECRDVWNYIEQFAIFFNFNPAKTPSALTFAKIVHTLQGAFAQSLAMQRGIAAAHEQHGLIKESDNCLAECDIFKANQHRLTNKMIQILLNKSKYSPHYVMELQEERHNQYNLIIDTNTIAPEQIGPYIISKYQPSSTLPVYQNTLSAVSAPELAIAQAAFVTQSPAQTEQQPAEVTTAEQQLATTITAHAVPAA